MVTGEFWFDLHKQLYVGDSDPLIPEKEGEAIYAKTHGERLVFSVIRLRIEESIPFTRELVAQAKDPGKPLAFATDELINCGL